jgi:hypothetical protein
METIITLGLILAGVFVISYLVDKFGKTRIISPENMKSIRSAAFLNAYLNEDTTQDEFVGKDVDASMEKGQDILWEEAAKFGMEFSQSVVEPKAENLDAAFATAVRIVKCVHTMQVIQKSGPLPVEPIIEVVSESTDEQDTI